MWQQTDCFMGNQTRPKPQILLSILPPFNYFGGNFLENKYNNKKTSIKINKKWFFLIILIAIIICSSISFFSDLLLRRVNLIVAFIILTFIIIIGIIFDVIGISFTVADIVPFHAMAAKKVPAAKIAINMIKHADKVSTICNDVVGDVCGIVSGSAGALIAAKLIINSKNYNETIISVIIGTIVSTFTIAGKSMGKTYAMNNSNYIVYEVSKIINYFKKDK